MSLFLKLLHEKNPQQKTEDFHKKHCIDINLIMKTVPLYIHNLAPKSRDLFV